VILCDLTLVASVDDDTWHVMFHYTNHVYIACAQCEEEFKTAVQHLSTGAVDDDAVQHVRDSVPILSVLQTPILLVILMRHGPYCDSA
jgi:hypothetical protein